MIRFRRRPLPRVRADVGDGFWVTEAPALQRAIRSALRGMEPGSSVVRAELSFDHGAEGLVVVLWRNVIVGFVPHHHAAALRRQLLDTGKSPLVTQGEVRRYDGERRVWAGPPWSHDKVPPPPYPPATIPPEAPTIFGVQLRPVDRSRDRGHGHGRG